MSWYACPKTRTSIAFVRFKFRHFSFACLVWPKQCTRRCRWNIFAATRRCYGSGDSYGAWLNLKNYGWKLFQALLNLISTQCSFGCKDLMIWQQHQQKKNKRFLMKCRKGCISQFLWLIFGDFNRHFFWMNLRDRSTRFIHISPSTVHNRTLIGSASEYLLLLVPFLWLFWFYMVFFSLHYIRSACLVLFYNSSATFVEF